MVTYRLVPLLIRIWRVPGCKPTLSLMFAVTVMVCVGLTNNGKTLRLRTFGLRVSTIEKCSIEEVLLLPVKSVA